MAEDGTKHLVALQLAVSEAGSHWSGLIADLQHRGLEAPALILSDGHAGLRKAIELWPDTQVQRCTWHKWQNLVSHCPVHARRELKRDYDAIVYAEDGMKAREAHQVFMQKWTKLCPAVARSLEEAGERLLTFYTFPKPKITEPARHSLTCEDCGHRWHVTEPMAGHLTLRCPHCTTVVTTAMWERRLLLSDDVTGAPVL